MKTSHMRRSIFTVIVLALTVSICFSMLSGVSGALLGDINGDGKANAGDANALKRVFGGTVSCTQAMITRGDMNGDGVLSSLDANYLSRMLLGQYTPPVTEVPGNSEPTIEVKNVTCNKGSNNVQVTVSIENNPGILAMMLSLEYDDSVMTLTSVENGEALSMLNLTRPGVFSSPCNFIWDGIELDSDDIKDGTILVLTFDIAEDAAAGNYGIDFSYAAGGIIDNNMESVELNVNNGHITVK